MTSSSTTSLEIPSPARDILSFWFGDDPTQRLANSERWFKKDPAFDETIRERFGADQERAAGGSFEDWWERPEPALAFILLTDQFSRNLFRDSPRAFATDGLALACSLRGQGLGLDAGLAPMERVFFYMPLMHSEEIDMQHRSVESFLKLVEESPPEGAEQMKKTVESAERHREFIARFGRFPHRNGILGRESTPEELEFLSQPGARF